MRTSELRDGGTLSTAVLSLDMLVLPWPAAMLSRFKHPN